MLPIDKNYLKTNLINWKTAILDPAYIIQKETLPTASVQNLGKIFQYIGSNSTDYTIGGFYQCQVVPGSDPVEYAWVEVSTKTLIDNTTIQRNANKELYVPKATDTALGVVKAGDGIDVDSNGVISVVARLEEIDELPTAAAALEGKIYLLTATQTGYDRGGIYMCEESTETAGTYEWKLISMSPLEAGKGITIENDVINADTNVFNGTLDEWEALTAEEQANYSHIATPEEASVMPSFVGTVELVVESYVTTGSTSLSFTVPFKVALENITTFSAVGRHVEGGYIDSATQDSINLLSSAYSLSVVSSSDYCTTFTCIKSGGFKKGNTSDNVLNNTPISLRLRIVAI